MDDSDIQTWWEIPSIVHFCKVFGSFSEDISPININEFERAVKENSDLLTNMAIRFIKICGFYDPKSNKWWNIMKKHLQKQCLDYNFINVLNSDIYFDNLTPKQKVEALYILCHIVLDVDHIRNKISNKPKLWKTFNVKPLGYDLNKSVYWYFGTTRLYREDFENTFDLSIDSSMCNDIIQNKSSNINFQNSFTHVNPSGIIGLGKWNTICNDDNNSWYSFADITQYSKDENIKALHNSICNIIKNLPNVKKQKLYYKYIKCPVSQLRLNNTYTRSLRSMNVDEIYMDENQDFFNSKNTYENKNKNIGNLNKEITMKYEINNINTVKTHKKNSKNSAELNLLSINQNFCKKRVNFEQYDQENLKSFENKRKKISIQRFKLSLNIIT